MPKLKVVKQDGAKIYPITIVKGIYDTERNQPLSVTLANKADSTALYPKLISVTFDEDTGDIIAKWQESPEDVVAS